MSELGYLPNLAASSLASASSYTIAMVVPSLSESGCAEMFAGLQKVLQPAGYHIMLAESQHHLEREEKLLETLLSYNPAAAVLLSVEHSQNARNALIAANIPVVEIGAVRADPIDMSIGIDYVAAMYQLTQTVIASGYQNIGLLCANQEQWIFQQHLQGWHKALLRNHMSPHRVINAAQPASFSTGAQQLPEFLLARRSWTRWCAPRTNWPAARCMNASGGASRCRTIWRWWGSATASSAESASRR